METVLLAVAFVAGAAGYWAAKKYVPALVTKVKDKLKKKALGL